MNLGMRRLWNKIKNVFTNELHANMSPLRASLSLALGILIGFSPFYGMHTILVLPLAFILRLNRPLALLASSATILPFVPLWIAAGLFTGKMVVSLKTTGHLVVQLKHALPYDLFDRIIFASITFCKDFFPADLFNAITTGPCHGHGILSRFVQWAIGSSVLAVVGAILTFAISYLLLLRIAALRRQALRVKTE
jgi:uncharacterized protein (DUF2062 family)